MPMTNRMHPCPRDNVCFVPNPVTVLRRFGQLIGDDPGNAEAVDVLELIIRTLATIKVNIETFQPTRPHSVDTPFMQTLTNSTLPPHIFPFAYVGLVVPVLTIFCVTDGDRDRLIDSICAMFRAATHVPMSQAESGEFLAVLDRTYRDHVVR